MANALVYSKEGVHRDKISKGLMALGFKSSFTADTAAVTKLLAEINPALFVLDWHSLDLTRNAQLLRAVDGTDADGKMLRIICCEAIEPPMLALAKETGVRKVLTYATLGLELKKVASLVQMGASEGQKFLGEVRRLRDAKKDDEANKLVEAAYAKDQKSPDVRIEYGNLLLLRGDLTKSKDIAVALIKEDDTNVRAMNLLSRIAMKAGDFATATKVLEKANVLSPKHPDRLALLGNAYYGSGDKAKASAAFGDALKEDPKNQAAVNGLGTIKLEQGDSEALVELFSAHSSEAETAGFFNNSAVQAVKEGKLEESLKLYEIALKALKTDRFRGQIYFNIALNYRRLGRLDEAQKACKRAVKYDDGFDKAKKQLEEIEALLTKKGA